MNDQSQPHCCSCHLHAENGNKCLDGMSLAMVYAPCQAFDDLYSVEEALGHGTLFAELDKPFWGARRLK